jgi:hypothetical protein
MDKKTALRLLKDLNQSIDVCYTGEWAEIDEEAFFTILKNYLEVEE